MIIDILLGAGESHGEAAVHWMFDHINQPYVMNQISKPVKNFTFKRKVDFTPELKNRVTCNFNFSDQHILNNQYANIPITTYLGFDVNLVSNSLHWLNKINSLSLLERKGSISLLKKIMSKKIIGSDDFAIKVSNGTDDGFSLYGNNEKEVTGKVAAYIVYRVFKEVKKVGVVSIDKVCSLEEVIKEIDIKTIGI